MNIIKKYLIDILVAITFGYMIFLVSFKYIILALYEQFPKFSCALIFYDLLCVTVITYMIMKIFIFLSSKFIFPDEDWEKEKQIAFKQLKLLGVYILVFITIIAYPQKYADVEEVEKMLIDAVFYVTSVFTVVGVVQDKRNSIYEKNSIDSNT